MKDANYYLNEMNKYNNLISSQGNIKAKLDKELKEKKEKKEKIKKVISDLKNAINEINNISPLLNQSSKFMTNVVLTGSSFDNGELSGIGSKLLEYSSSISSLIHEIETKEIELENEIDELIENIEHYENEIKNYTRFYNEAKSHYDELSKNQNNNELPNSNLLNTRNNKPQKIANNKKAFTFVKLD